jgi:hypothetical protein
MLPLANISGLLLLFKGDLGKNLFLSTAICVSRMVAVLAFSGTSGLATFGF